MAAKTQLSLIATPGKRYSFLAKTASTGVILGQGGTLIFLNTEPSILPLSETPVPIDINSNLTVIKI